MSSKRTNPWEKTLLFFAKKIRKIVSSALEVKDVEGGDIAAKEVAVEFSDLGSGDLIFIGNDCDFAITIWADNLMSRHSDRKRRARLIKDALRVEGYRYESFYIFAIRLARENWFFRLPWLTPGSFFLTFFIIWFMMISRNISACFRAEFF